MPPPRRLGAGGASALFAALALALTSSAGSAASPPSPLPSPPLVAFSPDFSRSVIYDNNPEQLTLADLADAPPAGAGVAHLQVRGVQGALRAWLELQVSTPFALGIAVLLVNEGARAVNVTIEGTGFTDSLAGGDVFVQCWNGGGGNGSSAKAAAAVAMAVPPGGALTLLRVDHAGEPTDIFSAVVDFTVVGGPVTVSTAGFRDFASVNASALRYEGYVSRSDPGPDYEARVVKGVMASARVASTPLRFVVGDDQPRNSTLPVSFTLYDTALGRFADEVTVDAVGFVSNDNPAANPRAIGSDMVPVFMPGWGVVNPQGCCDASGLHYNVGNWAVVYAVRGSVENTGSVARSVNISLTTTGCLAPIAYRPSLDVPWRSATLWNVGDSLVYVSVPDVAGGATVSFSSEWVLGGPACGGLLVSRVLLAQTRGRAPARAPRLTALLGNPLASHPRSTRRGSSRQPH